MDETPTAGDLRASPRVDYQTTPEQYRHLKVGYDGPWIFEVAGAEPPRLMLERLQRARRRLEGLLA